MALHATEADIRKGAVVLRIIRIFDQDDTDWDFDTGECIDIVLKADAGEVYEILSDPFEEKWVHGKTLPSVKTICRVSEMRANQITPRVCNSYVTDLFGGHLTRLLLLRPPTNKRFVVTPLED